MDTAMRIPLLGSVASRALEAVKDKAGSAAVEFSLVVLPFMMLIMSTFEVGWFFFANAQTDAATVEAARLIRTGQAQQGGFDKDAFFNEVCPYLTVFGDCGSTLTVEVETFASFAALAADTSPVICQNDDTTEIGALAYDPGADNSIVRIRVCLLYKTLNPTIGVNVSDADNNKRRLYGTSIFRNEPYSKNNKSVS
jgi:Flp pilus assembly protein TadG